MSAIFFMNFERDIETAKRFGAGNYAEDVVQEAYLRILESGKTCNDGYLYFTIRSIAMDIHRLNKKFPKVELFDMAEEDIDCFENLEYNDVEELLTNVHHSHRKVFYIYCKHIPSVRRMSQELNISQATLYKSIRLCQREIKQKIDELNII